MKITFNIMVLLLLTVTFSSKTLANGTITKGPLTAQRVKRPPVPKDGPQNCDIVGEEICPIGCPCPESWMGGALDPCYTPPIEAPCEEPCCFNNTLYLGAQVGYLRPHHKYDLTLNGFTPGSFHRTDTQNTVLGGVLVGGRYFVYENYFLGAEVSVNMDATSTRFGIFGNFNDTPLSKCRRKYSVVPTAVVGAAFWDALAAYIKLGIDFSNYRITYFETFGPSTFLTPVGFFPTTFKTHKTKSVFLPGVGVEYCFSPSLSFRAEVFYTFFPAKIAISGITTIGNDVNLKIKARYALATAGFILKF